MVNPEHPDIFEAVHQVRRGNPLRAFTASFVRYPNAVMDDPALSIDLTLAISAVFLDGSSTRSLTRAEIAQRVPEHDAQDVDTQIDRLREAGVLAPATGHAHEQRLRLRVWGYLGALFAERVDQNGLLEEFWLLLDAARGEAADESVGDDDLRARMRSIRRGLIGFTSELQLVSEIGTRDDVLAECQVHDRGDRTRAVQDLWREIEEARPHLAEEARLLIPCAQAYVDAVAHLVRRLHDDGVGASELFLLDAAQYEDALRVASAETLALFGGRLVVDRPVLQLDAQALLDARAVEETPPPTRPVPEPITDKDPDPLADAAASARVRRDALIHMCESVLGGGDTTDLETVLRPYAPASAIEVIASLLDAHLRVDLPYHLEFREPLSVSSTGESLSWATPGNVRRTPGPPLPRREALGG